MNNFNSLIKDLEFFRIDFSHATRTWSALLVASIVMTYFSFYAGLAIVISLISLLSSFIKDYNAHLIRIFIELYNEILRTYARDSPQGDLNQSDLHK